jgi:uncharacterized repeat protein (TIGR01451 family)
VGSLGEINPNVIPAGSTNTFTLDLLPTILATDPSVGVITVTAPAGYGSPAVLGFEVAGAALTAQCPTPGPGAYCATVSGRTITVSLGQPIHVSLTPIRLRFTATASAAPGPGDFDVAIVAPGGPSASTSGDANGYSGDSDTLTVQARAEADSLRSTVTASPPIVLADGSSTSTITVTLRDAAGQPVDGKTVSIASDRLADAVIQPLAPTDANGVATGAILSTVPGFAQVSALDVTESVPLAQRAQVTFTQGLKLQVTKTADRSDGLVGGLVGYAIVMRNQTPEDVVQVRIQDQLPPDFKYVRGTATLDGAKIPDPQGDRVLEFAVGTVPAFVDRNGNVIADPGEPGARVLRYQLVIGAGATPGEYRNLAVAKDVCEACPVSNADEAMVRVRTDELFTLGTILGKVFEDQDGDGRQGRNEPGVPGAMIGLDDGSYALTDAQGRYHFPAIEPGDRLTKINLASLPGPASATTEEARIVRVTPGLLAKANFGVRIDRDTTSMGRPAQPGLEIVAESRRESLDVVGTTQGPAVLLNGMPLEMPTGDVHLRVGGLPEVVELSGKRLAKPIVFRTSLRTYRPVRSWMLVVVGSQGDTVWSRGRVGTLPDTVSWDGRRHGGGSISGGDIYQYRLHVAFDDGSRVGSPVGTFGVNRNQAISLSLTGKAFEVGSNALSTSAREALRKVAETMRRFPQEKIVVEGHTDAQGSHRENLELSRQRATAAAAHLIGVEGVDSARVVLRWYGESQPVASNDTEAGRERNRRVEVRSQFKQVTQAHIDDVYRTEPAVRIDGATVPVHASGRFSARVEDAGADTMRIEIQDMRGQVIEQAVPLPALDLLEPAGTRRVPYGATDGGIRVRPRAAAAGEGQTRLISLDPAAGDGVVAVATLSGRTQPGNLIEVGRETFAPNPDGTFQAELPLHLGPNAYGLLVRTPEGVARIVNLLVAVTAEDDSGRLVIAARAIPELTVYLPKQGVSVAAPHLTLAGVTHPANRVTVNGQPVRIGRDGAFATLVDLPRGTSKVVVEATDAEGNVARIEREVERTAQKLYLLALADGVVGKLAGEGALEGAGRLGDTGLWAGGRLAYYLKGSLAGRFLVTSALDLRTGEFGKTQPEVDDEDAEWLARNLDPDRLYPIYGDSSTVVYDAQKRGRFYLAVDGEELQAMVGNYPLSLTDTELASFHRTLYGGRLSYRSLARTRYGDPQTVVTVIGAEARQQHVRDELAGTGGSLYYLSHRDVIEGSEQVALAIRDRHTGLILARIPQVRNVDYTVKHREGRLLFNRPIASVSEDGSLVSPGVSPGNPVTIEVDYEQRIESLDQASAGGRVQQRFGDHVAVGGTYLHDASGLGEYDLQGADLELKLGSGSKLTAEVAGSRGAEARVFKSDDGGISFAEITPIGIADGKAYKATADLDVGEWFGNPNRFALRGYLKHVENQFFAGGTLADRGLEKKGLSARAELTSRDRLTLRHDREIAVAGNPVPRSSDLTSLLWEHTRKRFGLGAEVQTRGLESGAVSDRSGYASGRLWWQPFERLTGRLEHQTTLTGPANDQTRLGLQLQVLPSLALEARGVTGTTGRSALGGVVFTVGEGKMYVTERLDQGSTSRVAATVVGAQAPIGAGSRAYTEYQWERGTDDRRMSVLGLQRRWDPNAAFSAFASGERGDIESSTGRSTRSTLAGGLGWTQPNGITASSRGEVRLEEGAIDRLQWLASHHVEARLLGGFTVLGKLRQSVTRDRATSALVARFDEHSVGFAYRPTAGDRVNGLARYTHLLDLRSETATDSGPPVRAMDVISAEAAVDVHRALAWSAKGALRNLGERGEAGPMLRTHSYLVIQRVDYALFAPVGVGVEYRWLGQREARDLKRGWLNEVTWQPGRHLRLGAGFNFTDFSDDEFSRNDYSVRGWFLRVQGKY